MARRNTKQEANIVERQLLALELRKMGLSYRAIGTKLSVSHEQARQDVEAELESLSKEREGKLEQYRQLELERLDGIMKSLDNWVSAGNPQAVMAYLKAMERRAKLIGLDAPTKQETTGTVDVNISDAKSRLAHLINRTASRGETPKDTESTE
jgi:hypothetical protein